MAKGPVEGDVGGGICYGCANYDGQGNCLAYGIPVVPERVVRSEAFTPTQGNQPQQAGAASPIEGALLGAFSGGT